MQLLQMKVTVTDQEAHSISFQIDGVSSGKLIINVYQYYLERDIDKQLEKLYNIVVPFKKIININDLPSGKMFKFNFFLENGKSTSQTSVFSSTKCEISEGGSVKNVHTRPQSSGLCESEKILYQLAVNSNLDSEFFEGKKDIKKNILQARKTKDSDAYINSNYKFSRPPMNKQQRLKRTLLVGRGLESYEQVYGFRQDTQYGQDFLKNDWFMGPFYSFDANARKLKSQQQ